MRHRIVTGIGLGNPDSCILTNNSIYGLKVNKKFMNELVSEFKTLNEFGGCDFYLGDEGIAFGIEPAYQGDSLEIIYFDFYDRNKCYWRKGISRGPYGSGICSKYNFYGNYKRKAKFVKFIDKWYDTVRGELCKDI